MSTEYVLGNKFWVYDSSSNPIAYATEATLSVNAESIDCGSKMSGVFAAALPGQISWNISTSCLYTTEAQYDTLFAKMCNREAIKMKFGQCKSLGSATTDISTALDTTETYYEGDCYITSIELSAGNNEVATYSVELTGNGKLTQVSAA